MAVCFAFLYSISFFEVIFPEVGYSISYIIKIYPGPIVEGKEQTTDEDKSGERVSRLVDMCCVRCKCA
jgi:hypothetical protein